MPASPSHPFEKVLASYRKPVEKIIARYLAQAPPGISALRFPAAEKLHLRLMREYFLRGGKYFRPTWLILTAEAMGAPLRHCWLTAAAMELSENWLLIHDDIEDHSLYRRGAPTLHRLFSPELALNAGDALHVLMWQVLCDNSKLLGVTKTLMLLREFARMISRTTLGQTAELQLVQEETFPRRNDKIFYIFDGKTSYYTVAGPMRLGAIIAAKNSAKLQKKIFPLLNRLGTLIGRAYQITDDILDLTSTFRGRKQRGNDIYEGKRTLLVAHLLRQLPAPKQALAMKILQKPREEKTVREVNWIIKLMHQYGSFSYAYRCAHRFLSEARVLLQQCRFFRKPAARQKMLAGIDFILRREF
jgi:geranylgeranyl diphosphate synthase type II